MLQFAIPIFLGAFLLFQVQPIIARCLLPWFGGTPAVWTTCMLFFQVLLLAGYGYAHGVAMRLSPRRQGLVHGGLLVVSLGLIGLLAWRWGVPIIPDEGWRPQTPERPVAQILALLTVSVGLPYFVLATTSPLLQAWFARMRPGVSPYRLYTVSNLGSLLALLSYPFAVEPWLRLRTQGWVWGVGYAAFVATVIALGQRAARVAPPAAHEEGLPEALAAPPGWRQWVPWVVLPAIASALLLAVTNQICQEVAVIPFLWIVPLSLYLLSFILTFDDLRWYAREAYLPLLLIAVPMTAIVMLRQGEVETKLQIGIYAAALFVCCMFCHGEVVQRRPVARHLTAFYLAISLGGALGGVFVALLAPLLFKRFHELHVSLGLCWGAGLLTLWQWPRLSPILRQVGVLGLVAATVVFGVLAFKQARTNDRETMLAVRNFYGVLRVDYVEADDEGDERHSLVHGNTTHGLQYLAPDNRRRPTSYYSETSGVGLALRYSLARFADGDLGRMRVAAVGLGTGTVAAYGQPGDVYRFYEINPVVEKIARDERYFTYLSDSLAEVEVVLGDARLSLEQELKRDDRQQFDVIVLDAFSSDSIPAHLLTKEAMALYLAHLRGPDGIIAVHVSNRVLDLKPVVWGLADAYGLDSAFIDDPGDDDGAFGSDWILLSPGARALAQPKIRERATLRVNERKPLLWTDEYHDLFRVVK
ncbi:MAG: fused MFS/spermidine synthase [Armatimonadia bacterium]